MLYFTGEVPTFHASGTPGGGPGMRGMHHAPPTQPPTPPMSQDIKQPPTHLQPQTHQMPPQSGKLTRQLTREECPKRICPYTISLIISFFTRWTNNAVLFTWNGSREYSANTVLCSFQSSTRKSKNGPCKAVGGDAQQSVVYVTAGTN